MSDESQVPARLSSEAITVDLRKPAVRYVEFRDPQSQQRLAAAAERAYKALFGSDDWGGGVTKIESPEAPAPAPRKAFFRRPQRPATVPMVETTPALARVVQLCATVPSELQA